MKLETISVHNHGDYDKEYVRLQAREDCDVGRYLLADTTYTNDEKVSNKLRHTYWFPDKNIKQGNFSLRVDESRHERDGIYIVGNSNSSLLLELKNRSME